jgi:N-acetylmuramoyl-L-alanine amidase
VFTVADPYRVIIDVEDAGASRTASVPPPPVHGVVPPAEPASGQASASGGPASPLASPAGATPTGKVARTPAVAIESRAAPPTAPLMEAPAPAAATSTGKLSLARQLGLGVARVVIDPGHGGHDPGAKGSKGSEAELVLDVALRLEALLQEQGVEVVLTRRTDVFVPLEERTAMANRAGADLFLSIHANASRNRQASGVETYFLNFASDPAAEEVAARENAASDRAMRNLPDIVQAIALNNKLDESKDFATVVQQSLVSGMRKQKKDLRSIGVKRAPFVVLIGASMPSVLAEISFITNKQEAQLLATGRYREAIAGSLANAILKYRTSLKGSAVATSTQR